VLTDVRQFGDVLNPYKGGRSAILATADRDKALDQIQKSIPKTLAPKL